MHALSVSTHGSSRCDETKDDVDGSLLCLFQTSCAPMIISRLGAPMSALSAYITCCLSFSFAMTTTFLPR